MLEAPTLVVFYVKADGGVHVKLAADEEGDDGLKVGEGAPLAADEDAGVVSTEVEGDWFFAFRGDDVDFAFDAHEGKEVLGGLVGHRGTVFQAADGDADAGGFGADAEDARSTSVQNVDLDLVEVDAEIA